jgi:hypothetical protein
MPLYYGNKGEPKTKKYKFFLQIFFDRKRLCAYNIYRQKETALKTKNFQERLQLNPIHPRRQKNTAIHGRIV